MNKRQKKKLIRGQRCPYCKPRNQYQLGGYCDLTDYGREFICEYIRCYHCNRIAECLK